MPIASIKIGVDLDPIPAIKGCVTFQADITTQRCLSLIRKELKHFKADVVLNDGAPNVGANWTTDAYNQIELSLYALKVATETLRKGGTFVTKVFRSKDYNALMYVANQLFAKVESNKPQSSRQTSAEIFMVCQGYKAPDFIDPRLLDPKFALEEVQDDAHGTSTDKITSLKKLLTTKSKPNRSGYAEGNMSLYNECDLLDFLQSADPHEYLSTFNKFTLSAESLEAIKDIKYAKDLEGMCSDLKVCGRREFSELLKLRYKYNVEKERAAKEAKASQKVEREKTQEDLEEELDRELDETIRRVEKEKKKQMKKDREREAKQDIRKKMSVIAATSINDDEELLLDQKTWDKLKQIDIDEAHKYIPKDEESSEEEDPIEKKHRFLMDGKEEAESDSGSEDEKVKRANRMAAELQESIDQQKRYKMEVDKRQVKKDLKAKALLEQQRQKKMDVSDDEKLQNNELMESSENDDDLEEERELKQIMREQLNLKRQKREEEEDKEEKQLFLNPLLAFKEELDKESASNSEDEWSDDDKYEPKMTKQEKREAREKERKLLGKRRKGGLAGDIDDVQDFFKNNMEEVPQDDVEKHKKRKEEDSDSEDLPSGYSSMDSDDIAETRALAKKMLRKKFREQAISDSYSRYAFDDGDLPQWFAEDEARNNVPNVNLTKEEVAEEKRLLTEWNARPSKKVTEAKNRKKMRLAKAMNKIKNKATVIASQDISEGSKMRQIQKLYKKEKQKHKEEKAYVVNRSFNSSMGKKAGRNVKMVDARMRADTRNQKMKKKGKGGRGVQNGRRKGKR